MNLAEFSIQQYWLNTLQTKFHQTDRFSQNSSEYFGTFRKYSKMVYNSGDYLGTGNCSDHLLLIIIFYFIKYIDHMLDGIKPLADDIFIQVGIKN